MKNKLQELEKFGSVGFEKFDFRKENGKYFVHTGLYPGMSIEEVETMANQLMELVGELKRDGRFKSGDRYYYIDGDGDIRSHHFGMNNIDTNCMLSGNIFKSLEEAIAHKDEIMTRLGEARKKYVSD